MTPIPYSLHETLLTIEDVRVSYGSVPVLAGVSGTVKNVRRSGLNQGQVVAILGPSGVGKTTLFKVISGEITQSSGSVKITSDLVAPKVGLVAVVSQHYDLFPHRTVLKNLVIAGTRSGQTKKAAQEKARQYLSEFGLTGWENHHPYQLSGGQKQRVAIMQQMMRKIENIIADEPFSGLDTVAQGQAVQFINRVATAHEHNTVILSTHNINSAVQVADVIWLMGQTRDSEGRKCGAVIRKVIDLKVLGLAWQPEITRLPEYAQMVSDITDMFPELV